jgi:hypothetical protein
VTGSPIQIGRVGKSRGGYSIISPRCLAQARAGGASGCSRGWPDAASASQLLAPAEYPGGDEYEG